MLDLLQTDHLRLLQLLDRPHRACRLCVKKKRCDDARGRELRQRVPQDAGGGEGAHVRVSMESAAVVRETIGVETGCIVTRGSLPVTDPLPATPRST